MDDLKSSKGFRQVFWNSPADARTAYWLNMIIYVETDAEELIKESETKLEEDDENEPETIATIEVTKTSCCVQRFWKQQDQIVAKYLQREKLDRRRKICVVRHFTKTNKRWCPR